ncbi:MAG: 2-amino-4-hydroxy-6-hydroxymethyldihydropteridine diphosphokinase [Pirellulales bacterium]|nr:2-amino-4-hydroxy-6-hydroxymethyldihydropteridine diphosphokinase [Pirellulales bacterium]
MPFCLIGLGSNVGDRRGNLDFALQGLAEAPAVRVVKCSAFYETAPVGGPAGQASYLNAAAVLETALPPQPMLEVLQRIERQAGRRPGRRWSARPLDLDLLLYDRCILDGSELTVPHPRMAWRRFVLEPASEVAGEMLHPVLGWTIARLREHLDRAVPYLALAGPISAGKTTLAASLCRGRPARLLTEPVPEDRLAAFYADPPVHAWSLELEFLQQRRDLLAGDDPQWSNHRNWTVSDFWFDQSRAFASLWLSAEQQAAFDVQYQAFRRRVTPPKLLVLLDAPNATLLDRIRQRCRPGEAVLTEEHLNRLRTALKAQAFHSPACPVLTLDASDFDAALPEVVTAMDAMT